jgi:hypothetical protein
MRRITVQYLVTRHAFPSTYTIISHKVRGECYDLLHFSHFIFHLFRNMSTCFFKLVIHFVFVQLIILVFAMFSFMYNHLFLKRAFSVRCFLGTLICSFPVHRRHARFLQSPSNHSLFSTCCFFAPLMIHLWINF